MIRCTIILFILVLMGSDGIAQSIKTKRDTTKKWGFVPAPQLGYSPETNGFIGASLLTTYNPFLSDSLSRRSKLDLDIKYTLEKQLISTNEWDIITKAQKWIVSGRFIFMQVPYFYYGIGNDTKVEQKELTESTIFQVENQITHKVVSRFYLGIDQRLFNVTRIQLVDGRELASNEITGSNGGLTSGVGLTAMWDSRNSVFNATSGVLFSASVLSFSDTWGSEFTYTATLFEARKFISLPANATLAMQVKGEFNVGNVPFFKMAMLGGKKEMRGYYMGRFRDNCLMMSQMEYRIPVKGRFGAVGFVSLGDVASTPGTFELKHVKPAAGVGLRFRLVDDENVNIRFDYARGIDGNQGFYVSFGEAF